MKQPLDILEEVDKQLNQHRCFGHDPVSPILLNVIKKALGEFAVSVLQDAGHSHARDFVNKNYPGTLNDET